MGQVCGADLSRILRGVDDPPMSRRRLCVRAEVLKGSVGPIFGKGSVQDHPWIFLGSIDFLNT